MAIEILMPALSPTMEDGTLAKWLVKEGDTVSSGDLLAEIETDKATMEFEAVDDGVIGTLLVAQGTQSVKVNTPIAILLEEGEDASATISKTSPKEDLVDIASSPVPPSAKIMTTAKIIKSDSHRVFASPLARRIAAHRGIDLVAIQGSGPHARIIKADVSNANTLNVSNASTLKAAPVPATPINVETPKENTVQFARDPGAAPADTTPDAATTVTQMYSDREYEEVLLDGMRKTIAARLTEAKQSIPHFYLRRDIRLDPLLTFRGQINAPLAAKGIKLSVNDFIIKACALALQTVPDANAIWAGDRILRMTPSDVAVAVAIQGGLFTPVLKDADSKTLSALSVEMKDLASRARDRKLAPHEYQGGSFAISNLGMFGIDNFDAVINPPHGAILAVGAGVKKPVVADDGTMTVATVMSVTLSVDHRVIDGALAAQLLNAIVENLENPIAMLA